MSIQINKQVTIVVKKGIEKYLRLFVYLLNVSLLKRLIVINLTGGMNDSCLANHEEIK